MPVLPAASLALAVVLARPAAARLPDPTAPTSSPDGSAGAASPPADAGWMRRYRPVLAVLAGVGVALFVGGPVGLVGAPVGAAIVWVLVERAESPATRRERHAVRRDLPHLVALLGAALRSGAAPVEAIGAVARGLPGPAADRLLLVSARLRLGGDPAAAWRELGNDPELGALGRTLARAQRSGAPVVAAVDRLAEDLARTARAEVEDRARAVGVRAAVPLGLCLLPAFVLIGIVPLAASLLQGIFR